MASELRLSGVDELLAELMRLAPDLAAEAGPVQASIAAQTAAEIRAGLPSDTGRLRDSVTVQREGSNSPARVFTRVSVTAPYAHFVEFGTARTVPAAVFVPATRRGREQFADAMVERVRARGLTVTGF
jgi:HK97 gp10 family phage protein